MQFISHKAGLTIIASYSKPISWHRGEARRGHAHISVLVGSDGYELGLRKGEALSLYITANVLHPVLRHLHDVKPRLVLVQRLQDNHLGK